VDYQTKCTDCTFLGQGFDNINIQIKNYILFLNKTLDGEFCKNKVSNVGSEKPVGMVNINNSYFKNNLKAQNWYYGSTTASDYKLDIFKRSITYNLTNCPIEIPYVDIDQQHCLNCPEGGMFNLGAQKCDICKPDEILNVQRGSCDKCEG
jgi:hypothetical protein